MIPHINSEMLTDLSPKCSQGRIFRPNQALEYYNNNQIELFRAHFLLRPDN